MAYTYSHLLHDLQNMNHNQLMSDVTIRTRDDEFFKCELRFADDKNIDVIDPDHPYFWYKEVDDL